MADNNIMAMTGAFIGVAILLGVGSVILGNSTMNCSSLSGYTSGVGGSTVNSTGWGRACLNEQTQSQSGYALLMIVLIVVAAVIILSVVRML